MQVWANYGREKTAGCLSLSIIRYSMTLRQRIRNLKFGFSLPVFVSINSISCFPKILKSVNNKHRKFGMAFHLVIPRYKCVASHTAFLR
jgi:hypothetical protein